MKQATTKGGIKHKRREGARDRAKTKARKPVREKLQKNPA